MLHDLAENELVHEACAADDDRDFDAMEPRDVKDLPDPCHKCAICDWPMDVAKLEPVVVVWPGEIPSRFPHDI